MIFPKIPFQRTWHPAFPGRNNWPEAESYQRVYRIYPHLIAHTLPIGGYIVLFEFPEEIAITSSDQGLYTARTFDLRIVVLDGPSRHWTSYTIECKFPNNLYRRDSDLQIVIKGIIEFLEEEDFVEN